MKRLIAVSLVAALGLTAAGCSNNTNVTIKEPEQQVEIKYLTQRTDIVNTTLADFIKKFEASHPNTKVSVEAVGDYKKIVSTRIAAGMVPDVFHNIGQIKSQDWPKYFEPLDDLGFNDKVKFTKDFSYEGKLYALPSAANVTGLVYNKKTWKKAGIESTPKTLDEFYALCDKLKANGVIPTSPLAKEGWPADVWTFKTAPLFKGDGDFSSEMVPQDKPFTSESTIGKSVLLFKSLKQKGYFENDLMSTTWDDFKKGLASGRFGFILMENWLIPQIIQEGADPQDVGFCPLPIDNSGKLKTLSKPDVQLVVSKDSKYKENSKEFVKFIMGEGYSDWLKMGGTVPVMEDVKVDMLPQIKEFMDSKLEIIWGRNESDEFKQIINRAQIKWPDFALAFILQEDQNEVFEKYNEKWEKAKKELSK